MSAPAPPNLTIGGGPPGQAGPRDLRTPQLEAFPVLTRPPELVPGRPQRAWMDKFAERHPYRCLPLTMANTTGWEVLLPMSFTAEWNGGKAAGDITFRQDRPHPDFDDVVKSHFTGGVITFHPGYLFRTSPGWDMLCQGPPNLVKDGVQPLVGLIETDWLPFPFTMNWIFTRPGRVRFEKGEPFCFITLQPHRTMDAVQPVQRSLASEPRLKEQFDLWFKERDAFNKKLAKHDPETMREAWQRFYFKGEMPPEVKTPVAHDHINKRRLKSMKLGR